MDLAAARLQCVSMKNDAKIWAQNGALNGEHALSDVDLTVYDGVDDVIGRNGHARGMQRGVGMGGVRELQDGRFNER